MHDASHVTVAAPSKSSAYRAAVPVTPCSIHWLQNDPTSRFSSLLWPSQAPGPGPGQHKLDNLNGEPPAIMIIMIACMLHQVVKPLLVGLDDAQPGTKFKLPRTRTSSNSPSGQGGGPSVVCDGWTQWPGDPIASITIFDYIFEQLKYQIYLIKYV